MLECTIIRWKPFDHGQILTRGVIGFPPEPDEKSMLIRLKVHGFKNLANVDVAFGPFTCIAGVNGVGKSNLFDAITFLSALADRPLMEAAKSVRDERHRSTDVRSLFMKVGDKHLDEMSFQAWMLVPQTGQDDLGQTASAAITFLKYGLVLRYRGAQDVASSELLEIVKEELDYISASEAAKNLLFSPSVKWRRSVVAGARRTPFLSTEGDGSDRKVRLHQDGRAGRPRDYLASTLPRTVLSSTNAVESPTALLARREMRSWRLLQLEPSALRDSDAFSAPIHVGIDGSHLASTLHHLARKEGGNGESEKATGSVLAHVANRLSTLVDDVYSVRVDEDRQRELLTLQVVDRDRNVHAARALSDGTLRFLALAILEMDPAAQGLLCFEEPENGIHPQRIESMLKLLKDLCVDTSEPVGEDNPLRQVIVNTHSPAVVGLVVDDDLLVAEPWERIMERDANDREPGTRDRLLCRAVRFSWLENTWRHRALKDVRTVSRGMLSAYLNPLAFSEGAERTSATHEQRKGGRARLVKDRADLRDMVPQIVEQSETPSVRGHKREDGKRRGVKDRKSPQPLLPGLDEE